MSSLQHFGRSIVLQMTCTIQLWSSFNPKITCLSFFPPLWLLAWHPSASILSSRERTALSLTVLGWAVQLDWKSNLYPASYTLTRLLVQEKLCCNPQDNCMVMWATADPFPLTSSRGECWHNLDTNSAQTPRESSATSTPQWTLSHLLFYSTTCDKDWMFLNRWK